MKNLLVLMLIAATLACSKPSQPNETTDALTATIVSRDPAKNTVNLNNQTVPGKMEAMKMDYEVRGAKVSELPPDGSAVVVTMHDANGSYYVTDVKVKK